MSGFYPADFETATWGRMEAHLKRLLAEDRRVVEGQGLDEKPTETVRRRARIGLLKSLLDLPDETRRAADGIE